ncbi:MAG TPA: acetate--CoA ligase family protein [Candidatus Eisenbacteria bacterium]|nr:acetate--CoA ligase family protein [Candidatus Eisenbacteria bacterium]
MPPTSSLDPLFKPRSIAVIGASRRRDAIGGAILRNLLDLPFQGAVYPINPSATNIQAVPAYPDIESVPGEVDLAIIVVPAPGVLEAVEACGRKGVKALVVITAGFKEVGEEGARREQKLRDLVKRYSMRLVGPNCLGILNADPAVMMNATFAPVRPPAGRVAFSSQSGALGLAILDYARALNVGISQFVSVGNKADVSGNDLIEYWEQDPGTDVILLYLESFGNPAKFTQIARRVARTKPIIAVKSGRSESGRRAASSHTGALAGSDIAVDALFRQSGVIRTDTMEELFDTALLLSSQPVAKGPRVAILTNAGGPGIMAADACEATGLQLPPLDPKTVKALRAILPAEASTRNPVDMIASANAESYGKALPLLHADPNVDAVIVIFVPPLDTMAREVAAAITKGAEGSQKPILSCFMGSHGALESLRSMRSGHIPSFSFPENAARALAHVVRYGVWKSSPPGSVPKLSGVDRPRAAKALEAARAALGTEGGWMAPDALAELLAAYGIRMNRAKTATNRGEAAATAKALGFPVVLKLRSPDVVHKSDIGGVRLNVRTEEEAAKVFDELQAALKQASPKAKFEGVSVERMVTGGVETIVGMTRDPGFGPLVLFGLGGVAVELLRDVQVRIAPLTDRDAEEMVRDIRGHQLLAGYRGTAPANMASLHDLLHRVSLLAGEHGDVLEFDLNPVLAMPGEAGCVALDARLRLGVAEGPEAAAPASTEAGATAR